MPATQAVALVAVALAARVAVEAPVMARVVVQSGQSAAVAV
jgi:hypothetical protein